MIVVILVVLGVLAVATAIAGVGLRAEYNRLVRNATNTDPEG
jgi:hypothetical protein